MRLERLQITIFLGVAALAWWLVLFAQGTPVNGDHLRPFSSVVGVLVILALAFERVLWRQRWLHGWLVARPDARGTWRVELQSDWVNPETHERVPTIVCYMGVAQTLSSLQMHLMTKESESWIIANSVRASNNGAGYQIAGVYTNKPHTQLRGQRSEMHLGGLVLDTHGPPHRPDTMTGEYWTDRKTKGSMSFTARIPALCTRFEDAERAFRASGAGAPSLG